MAKYKAYPEYKDSGVEWLGMIPTEWKISHFKWLTNDGKSFASGPFGSSIGSKFYQEYGVPVIRGNNLSINGEKPFFKDSGYVYLDDAKADELSNAEVIAGDLVFTARGTVGQVGLIPADSTLSWSRAILSANQLRYRTDLRKYNSSYLWYQFSSWFIRTQITLSSDSVAQPNLNLGSLKALNIIVPPLMVQKAIADFLDHETAKIDNLIQKQQQLIELLKEKRQAVISHAVTKGLNPDVPMKDSGVEWMGEVPEHWKLIKFSHCVSIRSGQVDPRKFPYCDYWLIAPNHIVSGEGRIINLETAKDQGADSGKYLCRTGEVIYSKIRPALVKACLSPSDTVLCSADMYPMTSYNGLTNNFLLLYLLSDVFTRFAVNQADRVAMPKINRESLSDCKIPVPPIDEQEKIYSHAREALEKLDVLLQKSQLTIEFFQERRTALISAAVTGKIDVRDWVAPDTQDIEASQEAIV